MSDSLDGAIAGSDLRRFATCDPPWLILKGRLYSSPDPSAVLSLEATVSEIARELAEIRLCDIADETTWRNWPKRFWPPRAQLGESCIPGVTVFIVHDASQKPSLCLASIQLDLDLADEPQVSAVARLIAEHCRSKFVSDFPQPALDR